jgi:hypothetical protein
MTDNITGRVTHRGEMHRRMTWKEWVRVASTANINLASPGASIDGISLAAGDRFLAKDQTAGAQNGPYVWNGAAVPVTRAYDMDTAEEVIGAVIEVIAGTVNAGKVFRNTNTATPTLGTSALTFAEFGAGTPITAKDEGSTLTTAATSFDFVGAGVAATNTGGAVTVTVTSAGSPTAAQIAALGFVGPILMTDGVTNPPEPLWTDDGTDYLYQDLV